MKILLLIMSLSTMAFASFNDFECEFNARDGEKVRVEIERSFGGSQSKMNVIIGDFNSNQRFDYWVSRRFNRGFNELEFFGAGVRLEIDLWPDNVPRWGRTYRADFNSWDIDNNLSYYNINCRYTRI
jgi:hypothetical protein